MIEHPPFQLLCQFILEVIGNWVTTPLIQQICNMDNVLEELLESPPALQPVETPGVTTDEIPHCEPPITPTTFEPPKIASLLLDPTAFIAPDTEPVSSLVPPILPLTIFAAFAAADNGTDLSYHPCRGTTSKIVKAQEWRLANEIQFREDERPPPEPPPSQQSTSKLQEWPCHNKQQLAFLLSV